MRRCYNDVGFLRFEENGPIAGVNLGYGSYGEQEDGLRRIEKSFGLRTEKLGLEGRTNTKFSGNLVLSEGKRTTALIFSDFIYWNWNLPFLFEKNDEEHEKISSRVDQFISDELALHKGENLATAWSKYDFGIHTKNEYGHVLVNLFRAFAENRGVISLSTQPLNPFKNSGLVIADYNLIPEEIKSNARENDLRAR